GARRRLAHVNDSPSCTVCGRPLHVESRALQSVRAHILSSIGIGLVGVPVGEGISRLIIPDPLVAVVLQSKPVLLLSSEDRDNSIDEELLVRIVNGHEGSALLLARFP
ncbi:hypothetical protein PMAYCL1PPCAC_31343, partial [Pristionchus mayeri]